MNSVICGRRKEGKSTLAYALAKKLYGEGVIIFDPRAIFSGIRIASAEELEDALQVRAWKQGPLCYTPDTVNIEDSFEELCSVLFPPHFSRTQFALVIDEAGQLQGPQYSHPALYRAVAMHPLGQIAIIQTAHRLTDFHGQSKALMDELYVFQTTHPGDLRMLLDFTGEPELSEKVKSLPPHHCLHYSYQRNEGFRQSRIINSPASWYSPITAGQEVRT